MPEFAISVLLLAELLLLVASWYKFQAQDIGVADALARSLALTLAGLGFAILTLFLLHLANQHWILDVMILAFAALSWRFGKRTFAKDMLPAFRSLRREPLFWFLLALVSVLFLLVLAVAPTNYDSMMYNLARVLMMRQENSLVLVNYNNIRQLVFSPGFDLLHFFFLRLRVDYAIAVFSFMTYGLTLLGSYALAKAYVNRAFGLRVAVVIACLKLPLLEAVITKNDLGAAAMAVSSILAAHSLLTRKKPGDLLLLLTCLAFGLSVKSYFMLFAAPFLIAFLIFNRTALKSLFLQFIRQNPKLLASGLAGVLLLTAIGMSTQIINAARFGNPMGPPAMVSLHQNRDGAAGTLLNVARYVLQIPDLPGQWWNDVTKPIYELPLGAGEGFGDLVARPSQKYSLQDRWAEDLAWFGLIGGFLIFPAVLAGLRAKDRLTRSVSFGLCGYFLLVSATIGWMPWNSRFFTLFFASSAVSLTWWRSVWHERAWLRKLILAVSILSALPTLIVPGKLSQIPALFAPGEARRIGEYSLHFPNYNARPFEFLRKNPPGRNILMLAGNMAGVYPFLLYSDHHWVIVGTDNPVARLNGRSYDMRDCGALLQQSARFDLVVTVGINTQAILRCQPPWKTLMRVPAGPGAGYISIYDPRPSAAAPAP